MHITIQLWHGFLLAAVLTGFSVAAYRYQAANSARHVDALTGQRGGGGPPPPGAPRELRIPAARAAMFEPGEGAGFYYVVWRRDGSVWARSAGAPDGIERPVRPGADATLQGERTRGLLREAFTFTPPGECLLVGRSTQPEQAELADYARWLVAISSVVLALGLAVGWWIATRAIRPIGVITSSARKIAQGELSERIPVREKNSELGRLSTALNETFAQLEASFARQSRFTAAAAHKLRTPVAIILAQAQRVLTRERDAATYQQTLEACVKAARRLQQLTESLLELAVNDAGALTLKLEDCDLAELTRETAALLQPLTEERRITLTSELAPARCRADSNRTAQIILNLLTHALDHTPADGRITLRIGAESDHASPRSPTPAAASPPSICRESSTASTAPMIRATAAPAAPASALRFAKPLPTRTVVKSKSPVLKVKAAHSRCGFRSHVRSGEVRCRFQSSRPQQHAVESFEETVGVDFGPVEGDVRQIGRQQIGPRRHVRRRLHGVVRAVVAINSQAQACW